jgi:hypothetical protein
MGVKQPGREADHSPPSSAEVEEWVELYLHCINTHSWRGAQLNKAQRQLYYDYEVSLLHNIAAVVNSDRKMFTFSDIKLMSNFEVSGSAPLLTHSLTHSQFRLPENAYRNLHTSWLQMMWAVK